MASRQRRLNLLLILALVVSALGLLPTIVSAESEPNDSIAQASPLGVGLANAEIDAALNPSGDVDIYRFPAEAGRTYVIETFNIPIATGYASPLGIKVLNSSNLVLVADENGTKGSGVADARVIFTPTTADTYFIRVASTQSWTGIYSLRILPKFDEPGAAWDAANDAEPNDVAELANALAVGLAQAQTHQMVSNAPYETSASDIDFYRFPAEAGRTYVIETFNIPIATGYASPLGIKVLNSSNLVLVADENGTKGSGVADARVIFTPTTADIYFIRVASTQSWTGIYSLRILPKFDEPGAAWDADGEPNDVSVLAYNLNLGAGNAQTHQLADVSPLETNEADRDVYRFDAVAGQTYVIETFNVPASSRFSIFRTGIVVLNEEGNELIADRDSKNDDGPVDARVTFQPPATRTYFVHIVSARGWTGTYSIRVCLDSCLQRLYLPFLRNS